MDVCDQLDKSKAVPRPWNLCLIRRADGFAIWKHPSVDTNSWLSWLQTARCSSPAIEGQLGGNPYCSFCTVIWSTWKYLIPLRALLDHNMNQTHTAVRFFLVRVEWSNMVWTNKIPDQQFRDSCLILLVRDYRRSKLRWRSPQIMWPRQLLCFLMEHFRWLDSSKGLLWQDGSWSATTTSSKLWLYVSFYSWCDFFHQGFRETSICWGCIFFAHSSFPAYNQEAFYIRPYKLTEKTGPWTVLCVYKVNKIVHRDDRFLIVDMVESTAKL